MFPSQYKTHTHILYKIYQTETLLNSYELFIDHIVIVSFKNEKLEWKFRMIHRSRLFFPTYRIRPRVSHVHMQREVPARGNHPHNNGSVIARACHSYKERADAYAFAVLFSFFYSCLSRLCLYEEEQDESKAWCGRSEREKERESCPPPRVGARRLLHVPSPAFDFAK